MSKRIPILFGTETGNAEYCSETLSDALQECGVSSEPIDMGIYPVQQIVDETFIVIVTSTYGNGDPPANARAMLEYLRQRDDPLPGLKYAVCALGDSSYPYFAQCGKDFDAVLSKLGAERVTDRVDCDDDFEDEFAHFAEALQAYFRQADNVARQFQ